MVYKNKKSIVIAVLTAFIMSLIMIMTFGDTTSASGSNKYCKYSYYTKRWSSYYLDEVPLESTTYSLPRAIDFNVDTRDNADLEQKIVYIKSGNTFIGTGFIIGDHEIMTAAHCVTNLSKSNDLRTAVIMNNNPSNGNEVELTSESIHVPDNYFKQQGGYDFAILVVKEDLSSYGQVFLGLGTEEIVDDTNVHALGYNIENNKKVLKISDGKINDVSDVAYNFSNEIHGGTSGGPLYTQCKFGLKGDVQEYKTAIGIIVSAWTDGGSTYYSGDAIRIRPEILKFVYSNNYLY